MVVLNRQASGGLMFGYAALLHASLASDPDLQNILLFLDAQKVSWTEGPSCVAGMTMACQAACRAWTTSWLSFTQVSMQCQQAVVSGHCT